MLLEAISATDAEMREIDAVPGAWAAAEALLPVTAREFRVILLYGRGRGGAGSDHGAPHGGVGAESSAQFKAGAELLPRDTQPRGRAIVPGLSHLAPLIAPAPPKPRRCSSPISRVRPVGRPLCRAVVFTGARASATLAAQLRRRVDHGRGGRGVHLLQARVQAGQLGVQVRELGLAVRQLSSPAAPP